MRKTGRELSELADLDDSWGLINLVTHCTDSFPQSGRTFQPTLQYACRYRSVHLLMTEWLAARLRNAAEWARW
jgi:hypothetical protein